MARAVSPPPHQSIIHPPVHHLCNSGVPCRKAYHKPENMLYSDQSNEATMSEKSRIVPHGFGPLPHDRLDDASDLSCWACSVVCSGKSAASLVLVVRGSGDARPFSLMCSLMCSVLAS